MKTVIKTQKNHALKNRKVQFLKGCLKNKNKKALKAKTLW